MPVRPSRSPKSRPFSSPAPVLVDARLKSLAAALQAIDINLSQLIASGTLTASQKTEILSRITTGTDFSLLRKCTLCIEAVLENAGIKTTIQRKIRASAPDAFIATNTMNLSIAAFASRIAAPELFVGTVFDFPPQTGTNVKIVRGPKTSQATVNYVTDIVRRLGKAPMPGTDQKTPYRMSPPLKVKLWGIGVTVVPAILSASIWMGLNPALLQPLSAVCLTGAILLAAMMVSVLNQRGNRMRNITRAMIGLASDDLTVKVPDTDKHDEIGDMARLVDIFKMITVSLDKLSEEEAKDKRKAVDKSHNLQQITDDFLRNVGNMMEVVASASTELQANAN
jgi:methyl-accepting chemotaxis protein